MSPRALSFLALLCTAPALAAPAAGEAALPDEEFCGPMKIDDREAALSCKLPGLPCGPVPAAKIGPQGSEPHEDLDGDGHPDITHAGRRELPKPETYGVIYLYRPQQGGYLLFDYHPVDNRADPQVAHVALAIPGAAPLVRDGYDLPFSEERTLSVARIRRFDGKRFRTLLAFCAHRSAPLPSGGMRDAHNRVDFKDVDGDGTREIVLSGFIRPLVYRLAESGMALVEDTALTARYRENAPEEQKARALIKEARDLHAQGQWRRAQSLLRRATEIAPYNVDALLELGRVLLRLEEGTMAIAALEKARALAPGRAAPECMLADAYADRDDGEAERRALEACLKKGPDDAQRRKAEERLRALSAPGP